MLRRRRPTLFAVNSLRSTAYRAFEYRLWLLYKFYPTFRGLSLNRPSVHTKNNAAVTHMDWFYTRIRNRQDWKEN